MKTITIILSLLIAGCASQQTKPTVIPEIIINYECPIDQADKNSLHQAILNTATCNQPITITITEYYKPDPFSQFTGWPLKSFSISGIVTINSISHLISTTVKTGGLIALTSKNMNSTEISFAKSVLKHVKKIK
jgi:hypothetical protein